MTVGTPGYMAPEQAMAQEVGPWTDLYSVGCMAYEMCAGQLPFSDSDEPIALLLRHINEPIEPADSVNPEANAELSRWIDSLLVKEPERRIASPTIAWETLEEILLSAIGPRWRRSAALSDAAPGEPPSPAPASMVLGSEAVDRLAAEQHRSPSGEIAPPEPPVAATVPPRDSEPPGPPPPPSSPRPIAPAGRSRRVWVLAGCALAVLIVAGLVIALVSGGGSDTGDGGQSAGTARGVHQLATILDFSAAGNHLSKQGEFSAAVQNRTEVASRLAGFDPPQALRTATATLTEVTRLAIQFNRQRLAGHAGSARKVDRQANALRRRFLTQFNPLAQRYLGRSYHIGEF
jgi:hypothetical protein